MIVSSIDRDYSLYKLVQDLQPPKLFTVKRQILSKWCETMEEEVVDRQLMTSVFVGFQVFSFFVPVMDRFCKIATYANQLSIFAEPDVELPAFDNIDVVCLSADDQLRREWFLIICHEEFMRAIVAREITDPGTPDSERVFEGIRTNHRKTIEEIYHSLSQLVERAKAKDELE